jgi:uncharacterized protein
MIRAAVFGCGALLIAWRLAAGEVNDSPLADAAMSRDMGKVRSLVREGADPNGRGKYDTPALLWVARVGDVETAELLIGAGADPNLPNAQGMAPLHLATENGDRRMVEVLLAAGAKVDLPDGADETALFIAARIDHAEIAELLVARGAEIDRREPAAAQTPLHVAAREGSAAAARVLIAHGADVNVQTLAGEVPRFRLPGDNAGSKGVGIIRGGWPEHGMRSPVPGAKTPLLYAARRGELTLARLLIEAGADFEQPDGNGVGPLLTTLLNASVAASGGRAEHLALAAFLLERGANVKAVDWYGETPLWAAVDLRNLDMAGPGNGNGIDRAAVLELITAMLRAGADPNARIREYPPERRFITRLGSLSWVDFTGQTPFLRAALAGDTAVMRVLVEHGADPNIATFQGTTPLMAAAGVNWVVNQTFDEGADALLAAVQYAHELGNDIDAVNSMGIRAVHGAANRGSDQILRYLAEHGANLEAADNEGRTPLIWAEGVFLATHPPVRKETTIDLVGSLLADSRRATRE